jgi:hypothetical protein
MSKNEIAQIKFTEIQLRWSVQSLSFEHDTSSKHVKRSAND